jgi:hypothetical protein
MLPARGAKITGVRKATRRPGVMVMRRRRRLRGVVIHRRAAGSVQGVTSDVDLNITGGCGCGAVRFEIDTPLQGALYCHCTRCQHRSGTAAAASARAAPGSVRVVSGEEHVRRWLPEGGLAKEFCGECGSALFASDPESGEVIAVRLGAFDSDPGVRPSARQFVAYAAPWEPIPDDGLPRFPERLPR